jgi:hypothetical protein
MLKKRRTFQGFRTGTLHSCLAAPHKIAFIKRCAFKLCLVRRPGEHSMLKQRKSKL